MEETIQYLQIITGIIISLLFIGLVILVFGLIKTMKTLSAKFEVLSGQMIDLKTKIEPALIKFGDLTENVNGVFSKINDNVEILGTVVEKVKDTADNIIEFEKKVQSQIEPPVMETLNTISAVSIGLKTFFDSFKEKREKRIIEETIREKMEEADETLGKVNDELDLINSKLNNN